MAPTMNSCPQRHHHLLMLLLLLTLTCGAAAPAAITTRRTNQPGAAFQRQRGTSKRGAIVRTRAETVLHLSPPARLRQLLQSEMDGTRKSATPILLPCCYDGITARLIARRPCFEATFMTGFGVSAVCGLPDTQLVSYEEMLSACHAVSAALSSAALETKQTQKQQNEQQHPWPIPCIAVSFRFVRLQLPMEENAYYELHTDYFICCCCVLLCTTGRRHGIR